MMKRIALISEHASPLGCLGGVDAGGQNVYVAQVARHLISLDYEVDVFTRRDQVEQPEIVRCSPGLRVVHVPAGPPQFIPKEDLCPYMGAFAEWMLHFMDSEGGYDLVHANFFMSGLVASHIKLCRGIPFVITFHALGHVRRLHQKAADRFPEERVAMEEHLMAEADRIIAECPQDREDQITLYGADPRRISVVPCGFDASEFWPIGRTAAREVLGLAPEENLVMHIGRMVRRKGVDNAIRGFARLTRQHAIPARMMIVGGESDEPDVRATPEIGYLQHVAEQEGVADRVIFAGRRGREVLRFYYCAADVFVTTPWYEPFGITPVEAMACGTPVIGANVGGIKYTVIDGGTGFLVPPNDPDALGNALAKIYQNPDLRVKFSRLATRRVNALYTWKRVAGALAEIYENVLSAQSVRPEQGAAPSDHSYAAARS